jgi:UDP-GlcNAc3NAcA epimerase
LETSRFIANLKNTVKWISVIGARPQFIKMSPLSRVIQVCNDDGRSPLIEHCVVHTGQHYDHEMAGLIFHQLEIPAPRYNLDVRSGSHGDQLARMLERMEPVFLKERADWIIVYGDTNSALAGALLAARLGIPLAHIEAGCRSYNMEMPEEQNRLLTDHLSQLLLAASKSAVENLHAEGIGTQCDRRSRKVSLVGDIMFDALQANIPLAESIAERALQSFKLAPNGYYLLTLHRAENTTDVGKVLDILGAMEALDLPVLFPVHPRTRRVLEEGGFPLTSANIYMVEPLGYLEMLALVKHARKIVTDSGGVQKEAFYLGVPCVTLREETEWPETVRIGANQLVGTDRREILRAVCEPAPAFKSKESPFGDGRASTLIVDELLAATQ